MRDLSKLVSQASVHLREATGLPHCGDCTMFIPPNACDHVQPGPRKISASKVCDDYDPLTGDHGTS